MGDVLVLFVWFGAIALAIVLAINALAWFVENHDEP
jgi:hypothetical protein